MQTHANTLYVQTQGAYVRKDHETVQVKVDGQVKLTVPLHHLEGIVCFGSVSVSPGMMAVCNEKNLAISFMTEHGRFLARVVGQTSGNVLLQREQYRRADRPEACLRIARAAVAAKIQNCRMLLLRAARETEATEKEQELRRAADRLACSLDTLSKVETMDSVRGCEGDAARACYEAFDHMIRQQADTFQMTKRTRRPPLDPLNALLSFLYSVLAHDVTSALEAVGLDPAVGFLHTDRPGRPSLALTSWKSSVR